MKIKEKTSQLKKVWKSLKLFMGTRMFLPSMSNMTRTALLSSVYDLALLRQHVTLVHTELAFEE